VREPAVLTSAKSCDAQLRKAGAEAAYQKNWSNASSSPMVAKGPVALRKDPAEALQIAEQF